MSGGYTFDPEAAKRVEKGLKDAVAELEEVGLFSVTSQQGHGFSRMSLSGLTLGDVALAAKFEEFCDRWGAAVKEKIDVWGSMGDAAALGAAVKRALDPNGILNAGRGPV